MAKKKKTFREWRKAKGLSVQDFARLFSMNYSTVNKYDSYPSRRPRFYHEQMIRERFPDCPLVKLERV